MWSDIGVPFKFLQGSREINHRNRKRTSPFTLANQWLVQDLDFCASTKLSSRRIAGPSPPSSLGCMRNLSGNFTSSPAALPDSQDQVWALGAHEAPEVGLNCIQHLWSAFWRSFWLHRTVAVWSRFGWKEEELISEFGTQERPQARGSFFSPCWIAGVFSSSVVTAQSTIHPALHSQPSIPPSFDSFKLAFSKVYFWNLGWRQAG